MKIYQNRQAENNILGMILNNQNVFYDLTAQGLCDDHFIVPVNKAIFNEIKKLSTMGHEISLGAVCAKNPNAQDTLINYLTEAPSAENPGYYFSLLNRQRDAFRVHKALTNISAQLANNNQEFNLIEYTISEIDSIVDKTNHSEPEFIKDFAETTLKNIEARIAAAELGESKILNTPLRKINDHFMMNGGDLVVIGARPGHGKTAFALNLAEHVAKQNKTVLYFTFEMPKDQIHERLIALDSRISASVMRSGNLSEHAFMTFSNSIKKTIDFKIAVDDESRQTFEKVKSKIQTFHRRKNCDIVIIDYLTLMTSAKKYNSTRDMINDFTMSLKTLAIELKIPIVLLCQLNRNPGHRSSPLPILSDLKESGSIEQDADAVLFLYTENDQVSESKLAEDESIIIIAKNRHGKCGKVTVGWDKPSGRFFNKD